MRIFFIAVLYHIDEICSLPNNERIDYVMTKLKDELNLEMKKYNVYQLLYRNGLIKHKHEPEIETTDTTTLTEAIDTTQDEPDAISGGPVDEQYLHQRIYEMFGVYCPIEEEDPFGYGE